MPPTLLTLQVRSADMHLRDAPHMRQNMLPADIEYQNVMCSVDYEQPQDIMHVSQSRWHMACIMFTLTPRAGAALFLPPFLCVMLTWAGAKPNRIAPKPR